jgi:hypothetical protein
MIYPRKKKNIERRRKKNRRGKLYLVVQKTIYTVCQQD